MPSEETLNRPLVPAVVLGIGFGAFLDGIVLHQVLGWHHTLWNVHSPRAMQSLNFNVVWDGMFLGVAWFATAVGIVLLWRAGLEGRMPATRRFGGGLTIGFALFNVVEGLVDLRVLLGSARTAADRLPWDFGFLVISTLLLVCGLVLARRGRAAPLPRASIAGSR